MVIDGTVRAAPRLLDGFHQHQGIQSMLAEIRLCLVWDEVSISLRKLRFSRLTW